MTREWEDASRAGDLDRVRALLAGGTSIDALDRYNQTALMHAAHRGDLPLVKLLVEHGANLEIRAKHNLSALDLARIGRHEAVVLALLEAGAESRPVDGRFGVT